MSTGRIEAFSDGVIAIILTIMVLELRVPADASPKALLAVLPLFLVYALSFLTVAIMWVNHHHYLKSARHADSALLWANNTLLFWMSLIPFATRYLGQNLSAPLPIALYGGLLAITASAFYWLLTVLEAHNSQHPAIAAEFRRQRKKSLYTISVYTVCTLLAWRSAQRGAGNDYLAASVLLSSRAQTAGGIGFENRLTLPVEIATCYHRSMTTVEILFRYERHPSEAAMIALGNMGEIYGIRRVTVKEAWQTIRIEYDATRLNAATVGQLLRRAGISVSEELPPLPQLDQPASQPAPAK